MRRADLISNIKVFQEREPQAAGRSTGSKSNDSSRLLESVCEVLCTRCVPFVCGTKMVPSFVLPSCELHKALRAKNPKISPHACLLGGTAEEA